MSLNFMEKIFAKKALHNKITPEVLAENTATVRKHAGFSKDTTFSYEAFNTLDKERISDYRGFSKTKGPGDIALSEKLGANNDDANNVRESIIRALKREQAYLDAQTEFTVSGKTFQGLVKKVGFEFSAQALIDTFSELKDTALSKITDQQQHEKDMLKAEFEKASFKSSLIRALNIPEASAAADIELVKNNMLKDLDASHEQQQANFKKTTDESLNNLKKINLEKVNELNLMMQLAGADERNLKIFEEKSKELGRVDPPVAAGITPTVTITEKLAKIQNVSLKDIDKLYSLTGQEIKQGPPGVFSVDFSTINPFYYRDPRQKPLADMMLIARLIKDSKYAGITMDIDGFSDPEVQNERAQQAFEACMRCGFKPENTTIRINGKETKPQEFCGSTYSTLVGISNSIVEKEKALQHPKAGNENTAAVKRAMTALKDAKEDKQEPDEPQPANGPRNR
jgi:hypothetical protein